MKIFGIGMNYLQHNKELDGTLYKPEAPVIFTKADSSLLNQHKPFFIPDHLGQIDYEGEVVIRIGRMGKNIAPRFVSRYIDAITMGIDFTARQLQRQLRDAGQPWDLCKGFDGAAAIGDWMPVDNVLDLQRMRFHLDINGQTVQEGYTGDMIFSINEIVSYISRYFTLKTGDIIYTGTPVGVGPVHIDDHIEGYIEEWKLLELNCK